MANWKYEGRSRDGKRVKGSEEAENEKELRKILRSKGIRPVKVEPPSILELDLGQWLVEKGIAKPFGNQELTQFTRQLATMINAGVPILQSLEILYKQQKNPSLKITIKKIASEVGEGKTLYEAMMKQRGFNKLYCNLIKAGETGGILDTILNKLADYMENQEKIKSQVKGALTYPAIVTVVGLGVIYLMMVFVVPQFTSMLEESGQEVPAITKFVIDTSEFLQNYTLMIVPTVFVLAIIFTWYIKSPQGKPGWDKFTMAVPVFGGIIIKGNLSSFARTLSTMLGSGVSLIDSLDICTDTVDNIVIAEDIKMVRKSVTEGKTLTDPLMKIPYFPEMVAQMVKVGESTGAIDEMLGKVSDIFENELTELIGTLTKLIEPLILVVLGGIIAGLLVAMYMPIFMSAGGAG